MEKLAEAILYAAEDNRVPSIMVYGHPVRDTLPAHRRNFAPEWQKSTTDMEKQADIVHDKVEKAYNKGAHLLPQLRYGETVVLQDPSSKKWDRSGTIVEKMKHRDYLVKMRSGRVLRRNRRYLRRYAAVNLEPKEDGSTGPAAEGQQQTMTTEDYRSKLRQNVHNPRRFIYEQT